MVLEFDHVGAKKGNVSDLVAHGYSLERVVAEVEQCEIVCANCHRRRTASRRTTKGRLKHGAAAVGAPEVQRNLTFVASVLERSGCSDCEEEDASLLEFDHVGPKRNNVLTLAWRGHSIRVLEAEIANCVVRCANCHRRRTHCAQRSFRHGLFRP